MNFRFTHLNMAIAASFAAAFPSPGLSSPLAAAGALQGIDTYEAPRVTQTIDTSRLSVLVNSHLGIISAASAASSEPDGLRMEHLQLVLAPSAQRKAALEALITNQHDPRSAKFHQWLSPAQFGAAFGVEDSDIDAITGWLVSQGFVVNGVYPNKLQIDFSGTVGQVRAAFHTQEKIFTLGSEKHLANASDVAVPTALLPVVAGVIGLNDFRPRHSLSSTLSATRDATRAGFALKTVKSPATGKSQAIDVSNSSSRALVPNDLMTMYGIRGIRANGITGKGVTIAVVEDNDMRTTDWENFTNTFNLQKYGGSLSLVHPQPSSGTSNCYDVDTYYGFAPSSGQEDPQGAFDSEWATAMAPGATVQDVACDDVNPANYENVTTNAYAGVFVAAYNVVNLASGRPDIISASYTLGESLTDSASKTSIDSLWAQADAEGISVFVTTGASGSNASFGQTDAFGDANVIDGEDGNTGVDANSLATSAHVTAVGITDTADILDGTTSKYFASTPSSVGGSALSYVPEIPFNQSCGNGVAAKASGVTTVLDFCNRLLKLDPQGDGFTSVAGGGGPSKIDAKPAWQRQVFNTASDQSRDVPDIALFGGSYGNDTYLVVCDYYGYDCAPSFTDRFSVTSGETSPLAAGIQALIDQGIAVRGLAQDQGNAAPTLYALAAAQYGGPGSASANIAVCNSDNGASGTQNCVFHNVTRGSISSQCFKTASGYSFDTPNCYGYGNVSETGVIGLTTSDATPTAYGVSNKAYAAQPGWSFAAGLGSVNTQNLLIAWRKYVNAPSASTASISQ